MLLSKIMQNAPDDVKAIMAGKPGMRHQGPALEAMRAVATAHQDRSLEDFEKALQTHEPQLGADPIIKAHLTDLYEMLLQVRDRGLLRISASCTYGGGHSFLQENICRIIEPYAARLHFSYDLGEFYL